jgi:ribonuclease BN (tRNA processing enzyme)
MRKPIIDHPFILKCYQLLLYHLSGEPIHDEKEILNDIRAIWNVSILAHCSM